MSTVWKRKVHQYSKEFLKFGIIFGVNDGTRPFCLRCHQLLSNESMKVGKLQAALKGKTSK